MFNLPVKRIVTEQVPSQFRSWVELALAAPLNRVLASLEQALALVTLDRVNVQVLERKGLPPSTAAPVEFTSTLTGSVVGVVAVYAKTLDTGGTPTTPVGALGLPTWTEVVSQDKRGGGKIRITAQDGLTDGTRYAVRWIAFGQ